MKQLMQRLRARRGETLVEAMISILIFTLSSIILFTMVTTATNINRTAKAAEEDRAAQLAAVESGSGTDTSASIKIDGSSTGVGVTFCRRDENSLYAYYPKIPVS